MENQLEHFANRVTDYLPNIVGALLVLLIGWLISKGIKKVVVNLMEKTTWDERLIGRENVKNTNVFVANIIYYILMIITLLIVLEILGVNEVLTPLRNMVNEFLSFIPNLIGAVLIGFIGYLLAKFVSNLVRIGGGFIDRMVDKTGFNDTEKIVNILKKVVFIVIFVPFLIQAFNALELRAISEPANNILNGFTAMIGDIIVAAVVVFVFVWGGKYLSSFLEDLFKSLGVDQAAEKIKIHNMIGANQSLSKLLANLFYFFLVFFGIITAVEILGLDRLTEILNSVLDITGQILFGLIILAIGNYVSLLIYDTMTNTNSKNKFIASIIRVASLGLFIAIALRTMGIANEIVELAFGLMLGAIAVAVALSYGLGGREAAGEHFKDIIKKVRNESSDLNMEPDTRGLRSNTPNNPNSGNTRPITPTPPITENRGNDNLRDGNRDTNGNNDNPLDIPRV
ncbi:Conserved TM helix [Flavobacteriaceae bacterium MAR_2010_188]|nr:Conserved TM helix [Flavobacteriaceae bacterium MAR_2010_188]